MAGLKTYNTPEKLKSFLQELLSQKKLSIHKGKTARSLIEKRMAFNATLYLIIPVLINISGAITPCSTFYIGENSI